MTGMIALLGLFIAFPMSLEHRLALKSNAFDELEAKHRAMFSYFDSATLAERSDCTQVALMVHSRLGSIDSLMSDLFHATKPLW